MFTLMIGLIILASIVLGISIIFLNISTAKANGKYTVWNVILAMVGIAIVLYSIINSIKFFNIL